MRVEHNVRTKKIRHIAETPRAEPPEAQVPPTRREIYAAKIRDAPESEKFNVVLKFLQLIE